MTHRHRRRGGRTGNRGAICPDYHRGCYGCFGPMESANMDSLTEWWLGLGVDDHGIALALRGFNAWAEPFRSQSEALLEIGRPR